MLVKHTPNKTNLVTLTLEIAKIFRFFSFFLVLPLFTSHHNWVINSNAKCPHAQYRWQWAHVTWFQSRYDSIVYGVTFLLHVCKQHFQPTTITYYSVYCHYLMKKHCCANLARTVLMITCACTIYRNHVPSLDPAPPARICIQHSLPCYNYYILHLM